MLIKMVRTCTFEFENFFLYQLMLVFLKVCNELQYAERLPIGLERVIRTVSSETVKHFYKKWYHLCNMAVIAVGDFSDTQVLWFFLSLLMFVWEL